MRRRREQEEKRVKMIMMAAAVICILLLVMGAGILLRKRAPEVVRMTEDTGKTAVVVKKTEKETEKAEGKQTENRAADQKEEQPGTQAESQSTAQKKEGVETQINSENIQSQNVQEQNASAAGNQNAGTALAQQPENNSSVSAEAETTAASGSLPEYTSAENLGLTLTDESVTLYSGDGSAATYIYKATDGNWYDGSGRNYVYNGNGTWSGADGSTWSETAPASTADKSGASVKVTDEDGLNSQTLYQDSGSGSWVNEAGGIYTDNGDGSFTGPDGNLWYS